MGEGLTTGRIYGIGQVSVRRSTQVWIGSVEPILYLISDGGLSVLICTFFLG